MTTEGEERLGFSGVVQGLKKAGSWQLGKQKWERETREERGWRRVSGKRAKE